MNLKFPKFQHQTSPSFPPAWLWFTDEAIPNWVKKSYSPRESWKDKPFSKDDSRFFFRGVEELSELFTLERAKGVGPYFQHPKYRSAYLLYFLPLQAAKFLTVFHLHEKAIEAALDHAKQTGTLRIADLGSGPGTASISLLLLLLSGKLSIEGIHKIELVWFDTNQTIMNDGIALVDEITNSFPKLRGKVEVQTSKSPWWKLPDEFNLDFSLIFLGHVLNEAAGPRNNPDSSWNKIFNRAKGGGVLFLEPAARRYSQMLSAMRDRFFEVELLSRDAKQIWGPCLHAGACPLAHGRDWCHFSIPVQIPGKWFKEFSKGLGSERQWLKFSYLWIASTESPAEVASAKERLVISDPIKNKADSMILICEPEKPGRWVISAKADARRGDRARP